MNSGKNGMAFSLVELVVALGVLTILVVILAQMLAMGSNSWNSGRAQADIFSQARVSVEIMATDLESAVLRPDLPAFFADGKPQLTFFARQTSLVTPTSGGNRPLGRVAYSVRNTPQGSNLRRSARGYNFGDEVGYSPGTWAVSTDGTVFDADIGPGVLIMRYQFIPTNGRNTLPENVNAGWTSTGANPGIGALRAITLSLAIMDRENLKILQGAGKLSQLQGNFSRGDPGPLRSFASAWQAQLDDPARPLAAGDVPVNALRGIKVFERTVPLPVSTELP